VTWLSIALHVYICVCMCISYLNWNPSTLAYKDKSTTDFFAISLSCMRVFSENIFYQTCQDYKAWNLSWRLFSTDILIWDLDLKIYPLWYSCTSCMHEKSTVANRLCTACILSILFRHPNCTAGWNLRNYDLFWVTYCTCINEHAHTHTRGVGRNFSGGVPVPTSRSQVRGLGVQGLGVQPPAAEKV